MSDEDREDFGVALDELEAQLQDVIGVIKNYTCAVDQNDLTRAEVNFALAMVNMRSAFGIQTTVQ